MTILYDVAGVGLTGAHAIWCCHVSFQSCVVSNTHSCCIRSQSRASRAKLCKTVHAPASAYLPSRSRPYALQAGRRGQARREWALARYLGGTEAATSWKDSCSRLHCGARVGRAIGCRQASWGSPGFRVGSPVVGRDGRESLPEAGYLPRAAGADLALLEGIRCAACSRLGRPANRSSLGALSWCCAWSVSGPNPCLLFQCCLDRGDV